MKCKLETCSARSGKSGFCSWHWHNNEIKTINNICYLTTYCKDRKFIVKFDKEFLKKVKDYKWCTTYHIKLKNYYVVTHKKTEDRELLRLHQLILPAPFSYETDHCNRDTMNCLKSNLRIVTHLQNSLNCGKQRNNISGYIGVSWHKVSQKWSAYTKKEGKQKHLGLFVSKIKAALARDKEILRLYPNEKIELNFNIK